MREQDEQSLEEVLLDEVSRIRAAAESIALLVRLFGVVLLVVGLIALIALTAHLIEFWSPAGS